VARLVQFVVFFESMKEIDHRRADLNLLVVFQKLFVERHVGRAARRLGLTQSAASHALSRLRIMFGDPLFVRHPKGIEPTSRAQALAPIVADILDRASSMLASAGWFDPNKPHTFTIGGTDLAVFTILVPLIKRLRETAANVDLRVRSLDGTRAVAAFDRQEIDCALIPFSEPPARIAREPAIKESFVGIARRGHPALRGKRMTAAKWAALPHLLVSPRGENSGEADEHLAKLGLKRRVVAVIPHFLAAPIIVANSDLVMLATRRVARHFAKKLDLTMFKPPIPMPGFTIDVLTSAARATDPALQWLRNQILQICSEDGGSEDASGFGL
jgi:DNA-binding transcriptional LysR family regulator